MSSCRFLTDGRQDLPRLEQRIRRTPPSGRRMGERHGRCREATRLKTSQAPSRQEVPRAPSRMPASRHSQTPHGTLPALRFAGQPVLWRRLPPQVERALGTRCVAGIAPLTTAMRARARGNVIDPHHQRHAQAEHDAQRLATDAIRAPVTVPSWRDGQQRDGRKRQPVSAARAATVRVQCGQVGGGLAGTSPLRQNCHENRASAGGAPAAHHLGTTGVHDRRPPASQANVPASGKSALSLSAGQYRACSARPASHGAMHAE